MLLAGSRVLLQVADLCPKGYKKLREVYADSIDNDYGILQKDVTCPSPSAAAVFVVVKNANGLTEWKTAKGLTLKELEGTEQ